MRPWGLTQIAGYQIECEVGHGGMATVYRAVQQSLGRQVALKILAHRPEEDSDFVLRFKKEGRILAQLLHPNIITIYDVGISEDNRLFLSVEYLPGGTLKDRIRQGIPTDSVIEIMKSISNALGYAHERGVIHRDIKPSNIMFRHDGTPVLTDFGVARVVGSKTVHTLTGFMVGSPGYMSPEQAMGESATIQSDLYGLGVVLYEMLTGNPLYKADNPLAIMLKHLHDPIPKLPKEHVHLQSVLNKLLAKKIEKRYKNANELLEALNLLNPSDNRSRPGWNSGSKNRNLLEFSSTNVQSLLNIKSWFFVWFGFIIAIILLTMAVYFFQSNTTDTDKPVEQGTLHQRQIMTLLRQAEIQVKTGFLTGESEQSAESIYRRILILDPVNVQASKGMEDIANEYERLARQNLNDGALRDSLALIDKGLMLTPGREELIRLRQEAEQRIVQQQARQAQQELQQQHQLQAEQFLIQAQNSFQEGQFEVSLAHIEQGLLAMPNHQHLLALRNQIKTQLAEAEMRRQREEEARRQMEIAERQQVEAARRRKEADQYLARATGYLRIRKYSASLQQIEKGLTLVPSHEGLLVLREKVHTERSAEQQRQDTLRQASKEAKAKEQAKKQFQPAIPPTQDDDANLKKLQSIKNSIDALDKALGK
ncbi:MAG: serine/threonine-protein kinase [Candidatus Competibacter sp.]|nr:serine/threonine-protein kinase [Candidatus Competibacter sp.]